MKSLLEIISADFERYFFAYDHKGKNKNFFLKLAIFFHNPNLFFLIFFRIECALYTHKNKALRLAGLLLYPFYFYICYFLFDIHIHPATKIKKGLYLHYKNIIITQTAILGQNTTLIGPLTIGTNLSKSKGAIIEDNVTISAGARVIGDINIGKNAIIGANAVVVKNVSTNSTVGGVPAKNLHK